MYLKLSVAGHLTIFLTRTRGPFWSIRPAKILWIAVLGTQIVATLIAVYGVFMTPLGWGWAGFVWAYAIGWFLINDRVKLLAYRIFDPENAKAVRQPKPEAKTGNAADVKDEPKPIVKIENKPDGNAEPNSETKPDTKSDKTPEEPTPVAKTDDKPDAKVVPKPETKPETKSA